MSIMFVANVSEPERNGVPAYWFIFHNGNLLLNLSHENGLLNCSDPAQLGIVIKEAFSIGRLGETDCIAALAADNSDLPAAFQPVPLRQTYLQLGESWFAIAGRASHLLHWHDTHRYCGKCGEKLPDKILRNVKTCSNCGREHFPRIAPAMIVAVTRGDEILLAKSTRWRHRDMYSVLAGFVDPGESLEECVAREIYEETAIRVKNIRYYGSQAWPFPNALMIGFTAEYESGEIEADPEEIVEAKWFPVSNLPSISQPPSIARKLIDDFVCRHQTPK